MNAFSLLSLTVSASTIIVLSQFNMRVHAQTEINLTTELARTGRNRSELITTLVFLDWRAHHASRRLIRRRPICNRRFDESRPS